jgi:hypothetical protein
MMGAWTLLGHFSGLLGIFSEHLSKSLTKLFSNAGNSADRRINVEVMRREIGFTAKKIPEGTVPWRGFSEACLRTETIWHTTT